MKAVAPWLCVAALAAALIFNFSNQKKQSAELEKLRADQQEVAKIQAEYAELKPMKAELTAKIERLESENTEVHKLRNEARQLREEKKALMQQTAQLQAQQQQVHVDPQQQAQLQQLQRENDQYRQVITQGQARAAGNACINNLKQLDGAKEQWALEYKKSLGDVPTWPDLIGPKAFIKNMPVCPQGGQYTLYGIGQPPTCSVPGHILPQ